MSASTITQRKICTLGDFSVGKTSLIRRYVEGVFDEKYLSTIGVWISRKLVRSAAHQVNLIIWDLAGGNDYLKHNTNYLRGAAGGIIMCDLTRPDTIPYLSNYAKQLRQINPKSTIIFVGNKIDLIEKREGSGDQLAEISEQFQTEYLTTSAKTGENVEFVFQRMTELIFNGR